MSLKNKTVLVTGSSRGIGKAIATEFCRHGCNVIFNASKSSDDLNSIVSEEKALGFSCIGILADVSDYSECQNLFQCISKTFGDVDILINNAGVSHIGLFTDMSPAEWRKILDINLGSVLNCTHIALPPMIRKKSGAIINISSMWGEKGASCEAVYSASKGGLNAFTKSIAKEAGPSMIRTNAISCGVIDTKMNDWLDDDERAILVDEISLMRFGNASEVARLAVFLADEETSGFINGQIITIDGGMY